MVFQSQLTMVRIVSVFIVAVAAFFGLSASAQTCRISGTNGDTIEELQVFFVSVALFYYEKNNMVARIDNMRVYDKK